MMNYILEQLEHNSSIKKYEGKDNIITIPEQLDDRVIQEVSDYSFCEHREIEQVILPHSVKRIGNHAFYNCRKLKQLSLTDNITEIGDGAFKNCENLSHIMIEITQQNMSCIRGILSEVNEELTITLHYPNNNNSVMIFPKYNYDYVENTQARIINQVTHGTGVHYRECVGKTDINYKQYDALFDLEQIIGQKETTYRIAVFRIGYPYQLLIEDEQRYREYIKAHIKEIALLYLREKDIELLTILGEQTLLEKEDLSYFLEEANKLQYTEGISFLLSYQNRYCKTLSNIKSEFKL